MSKFYAAKSDFYRIRSFYCEVVRGQHSFLHLRNATAKKSENVFMRHCLDKRLQGLLVICIESLAILTNYPDLPLQSDVCKTEAETSILALRQRHRAEKWFARNCVRFTQGCLSYEKI